MWVARTIWSLGLLAALVAVSPPARASDEPPLPRGVYRAGKDVSLPKVVKHVDPSYTFEAMRHEIHGIVRLDCIVGVDGKVGDVQVVRSLDRFYGLDKAAVDAAKQWTFDPGLRDGLAVPVMVTIEMTFAMDEPVRAGREKR